MAMDWVFSFEENESLTFLEFWLKAIQERPSPLGHDRRNVFCDVKESHVNCYLHKTEFEAAAKAGERLLEKVSVKKVFDEADAKVQEFALFKERISGASALEGSELLKLYLDFWRVVADELVYFEVTQPEYLVPAEEKLRVLLQANGLEGMELEEAVSLLSTPTDLDVTKREEIDFLKVTASSEPEEQIMEHVETHPWLSVNTPDERLVKEFLSGKLKELKITQAEVEERIKQISKEKQDIVSKQNELLEKLRKSNEEIGELSKILKDFGVYRFELKAVWAGSEYVFRKAYEEIAKRLGITIEDLRRGYRVNEVVGGLTNGSKVAEETVAARKRRHCFWLDGKELKFYEGEQAEEISSELLKAAPAEGKEIRGSIANPGKAVGKARIVEVRDLTQLVSDIKNFQEGEILVTTMTQPSMVVLAKKAAAIVTNEGGITCHAAVLSREFKIPCVVGTRNATQFLKTGDSVEVDATKGVVRKIQEK